MSKYKIAVAVLGAGGRMGQALAQVLPQQKMSAAFGVSSRGEANGYEKVFKSLETAVLKKSDILIDFSSPTALMEACLLLEKTPVPLVSGTTGLTPNQMKEIKKISKKMPVLWAPNMSLGVAALRRALVGFSALQNFEFQVEEIHHNKKKDAPSGTAIVIQNDLENLLGRKLPPIISVRAGGVIGDHKVSAYSQEEILEIRHSALNRSVFAAGAAAAARWIVKQKPGLYNMDDILNEK